MRGGKRPGAGRPKGGANKLQMQALRSFELRGKPPAEWLDDVMNGQMDGKKVDDPDLRVEAAKALMPYVHKRQPVAVEGVNPAAIGVGAIILQGAVSEEEGEESAAKSNGEGSALDHAQEGVFKGGVASELRGDPAVELADPALRNT